MIKKLIFLMIFFLMIGSVSAVIYHPLPLNGEVIGKVVGDLQVDVTNMRTNEVMTTYTTGQGEYLIDWANSDDNDGTIVKYVMGDRFRIAITTCQDRDDCVKHIVYNGEPEVYTSFDLSNIHICPVDTTPYSRCDSCCGTCPLCPECPENINYGLIIGAILTLIVAMGGGIKIYKNRLGNATFQHRHIGIKEYHSPNTKHKNLKYQHRLWRDDPMGCIADVKKIYDNGGLI